MSGKTLTLGLKAPSPNMTPDRKILILSAISIVALVIASVSATMILLPQGTPALPAARTVDVPNIANSPVAPPRTHTTPQNVTFVLETLEVVAEIETGATYRYWTFNGTVPGPMLRVIDGDNVNITIVNPANSQNPHSIDLHAVIGPGGGADYTETPSGQTTSFKFKATREGLYVYHCASGLVDHHIANGMYGLVLVEPVGGLLPTADKEFYVMQGEFYTEGNKGPGHHDFSTLAKSSTQSKMLSADPDYVVFNGKVNSLIGTGNALTADVGQTVRIYFGVGGPNLVSSFHIIGEIFDRVYPEGSLNQTQVLTNVQTTLIPAGGSTIVEFTPHVIGGKYWLVDHSLTRAIQKGAIGQLVVTGTSDPGIYGFP